MISTESEKQDRARAYAAAPISTSSSRSSRRRSRKLPALWQESHREERPARPVIPEARELLEIAGSGIRSRKSPTMPTLERHLPRGAYAEGHVQGLFRLAPLTALVHAAEDLLVEVRAGALTLEPRSSRRAARQSRSRRPLDRRAREP